MLTCFLKFLWNVVPFTYSCQLSLIQAGSVSLVTSVSLFLSRPVSPSSLQARTFLPLSMCLLRLPSLLFFLSSRLVSSRMQRDGLLRLRGSSSSETICLVDSTALQLKVSPSQSVCVCVCAARWFTCWWSLHCLSSFFSVSLGRCNTLSSEESDFVSAVARTHWRTRIIINVLPDDEERSFTSYSGVN